MLASVMDDLHRAKSCQQRLWLCCQARADQEGALHLPASATRPQEDKHLTRQQVRKLIAAAKMFHVRLAIILLYTTAARASALCGLTWDRCNFERDRIDLRDATNHPARTRNRTDAANCQVRAAGGEACGAE